MICYRNDADIIVDTGPFGKTVCKDVCISAFTHTTDEDYDLAQ